MPYKLWKIITIDGNTYVQTNTYVVASDVHSAWAVFSNIEVAGVTSYIVLENHEVWV
jgi:hypothetical protein